MKEQFTKCGKHINFKIINLNKENYFLFDSVVIQAIIDSNIVGYLKLNYLTNTTKENILIEPFDYFIYKVYGDNSSIIKNYQEKEYNKILCKVGLRDLKLNESQIKKLTDVETLKLFISFKKQINNLYLNQFNYFIDYWLNKPSIELVRVFSDLDKSYTDYNTIDYQLKNRDAVNWQGKGIGLALYEKAITWCKNNNLELWASLNRTEDGKKIWKALEKYPKFSIIMTHINKYSEYGELIIKKERQKIKFI